jgi:sensor histidine kinase YesM
MGKQADVKRWLLYGSIFVILAAAFAFQAYLGYSMRGNRASWLPLISWEGTGWALWGVLAPFIFSFARRYPLDRKRRRAHHLAMYVAAALFFSLLHLSLHVSLDWVVTLLFSEPYGTFVEILRANFFSRITWRIFLFAAIVVAAHGYEARRKLQAEEQNAAELRAQLAQAQLQALKMQIHPHFLFNTLHSLSELIHRDVRAADELVVRLGDFLRMTLQSSDENQVPLRKEIEFLQCYLEIEKARLQDRLGVQFEIDPATRDLLVPNLLLQPIVENAIRHGIAPRAGAGKLSIQTGMFDSMLKIVVQDDGAGMTNCKEGEFHFDKGLGLANTRDRLQKMYGANHRMRIENVAEGSGFRVSLEFPAEKE